MRRLFSVIGVVVLATCLSVRSSQPPGPPQTRQNKYGDQEQDKGPGTRNHQEPPKYRATPTQFDSPTDYKVTYYGYQDEQENKDSFYKHIIDLSMLGVTIILAFGSLALWWITWRTARRQLRAYIDVPSTNSPCVSHLNAEREYA